LTRPRTPSRRPAVGLLHLKNRRDALADRSLVLICYLTGGLGTYELLGTIGLATAIILGMRVVAATGHDPGDR
jgi:hypothetical protein